MGESEQRGKSSREDHGHFAEHVVTIEPLLETIYGKEKQNEIEPKDNSPNIAITTPQNSTSSIAEDNQGQRRLKLDGIVAYFRQLSCIQFCERNLSQLNEGAQQTTRLTALLAAISLVCVMLVIFVAVQNPEAFFGQRPHVEEIPSFDDTPHTRQYSDNLASPANGYPQKYTWNEILHLARTKTKIHFEAAVIAEMRKGGNQIRNRAPHLLEAENESDGSLKIIGRPPFCSSVTSTEKETEKVVFGKSTHVHLSDMEDCRKYAKLILTKYYFPNVQKLKIERMDVDKELFMDLVGFIDRHRETIEGVEVEDCYLCPSPECDAGMINYPDNDFEFKISRRRSLQNRI